MLTKETPTGDFAKEWKDSFSEVAKEVEEVDIAAALSTAAFAVKDERELVSFQKSHMSVLG